MVASSLPHVRLAVLFKLCILGYIDEISLMVISL